MMRVKIKVRKEIILAIVVVVIGLAFAYRSFRAGVIIDHPLDPSIFDDANVARIEIEVERTNVLTARVKSIDKYKYSGVQLTFDDYPHVIIYAKLNRDDVARINPGDLITVRGKITYRGRGAFESDCIAIGTMYPIWPISFKAQLVGVNETCQCKPCSK